MTLNIQTGKRYVMRYGGITGVMRENPGCFYDFTDGEFSFRSDGAFSASSPNHNRDLIAEYNPHAPPCELRAGGKYETVNPDGTPGPVVETYERLSGDQFSPYLNIGVKSEHAVLPCGLIIGKFAGYHLHGYRITREYIEPKPPTPLERLKAWREEYRVTLAPGHTLDAIIADLEKQP